MNPDPNATIVIPCFNQAVYLSDAIESALAQTVPVEVIVVNDGSTDDTTAVALRYPVTLIVQKNRGLASARNSGISLARNRYILPLDADDRIGPHFVERCLPKLNVQRVVLVGTGMITFGEYSRLEMPPDNVTAEDLWPYNRIYCSSMFPKQLWQELGGYDEKMCRVAQGYEDWEFWLRLLRLGRFALVPEYLFFYRKHGRSMIDDAVENHVKLVDYIRLKHAQAYGAG